MLKSEKMREQFYPGTETLAPNEMRITALGTGRPFLRRSQANTSFLVELGNGDIFMFDFGSGSQLNFTALEIPYEAVTGYFLTHLHADHAGDFPNVWVGGWAGGRLKALEVWGPSGAIPEHGTKHFVETQISSWTWDTSTRTGLLPEVGQHVEVHEFDYATPAVIYDRNGVSISSFPAVHILDGPVSYRLEWNGRVFVFSGDTTPSQFMIDYGQGADVLIHECFNTVGQLMDRSGYDERTARGIGTWAHSSPDEVGVVLAKCAPKLAVLYHHFNDFDTASEIESEVRKAYAGPLMLARDLMVINVKNDDIAVRMAIVSDHVWPNKRGHDKFRSAVRAERPKMSQWLADAELFPKGR